MAARLDQLPGFEIAFSQPIIDSVLDYVFDPHSELAIKVFGDDFNELRRIGNDIIGVLEYRAGRHRCGDRPVAAAAADFDQGRSRGHRALRHQCRRRRQSDQTGIGGGAVSQLFIGERHYDMTVRFPAEDRNNPEAIRNLVLTSSDGALVPLSQVAEVKLQTGESMINREMNHRYLLVKLNYHDRDPLSVVAEVESHRAKGQIRPAKISHRMGRPVRRTSSAPKRASG